MVGDGAYANARRLRAAVAVGIDDFSDLAIGINAEVNRDFRAGRLRGAAFVVEMFPLDLDGIEECLEIPAEIRPFGVNAADAEVCRTGV